MSSNIDIQMEHNIIFLTASKEYKCLGYIIFINSKENIHVKQKLLDYH
jgi:hypothetical protein